MWEIFPPSAPVGNRTGDPFRERKFMYCLAVRVVLNSNYNQFISFQRSWSFCLFLWDIYSTVYIVSTRLKSQYPQHAGRRNICRQLDTWHALYLHPSPPPPSPVITNLSLLPYCIPTTYFRNRNIKKCMQDRGIMAIEAVRMTIETIK